MKCLLIVFLLFCAGCSREPYTEAKAKAEMIASGCIKDVEYIQGSFFDSPEVYIKFRDGSILIIDWSASLESSIRIGSCGKLYQRQDDESWTGYSITWEDEQ